MLGFGILNVAISSYAFGAAAALAWRSPKWRFRFVAILGLVATAAIFAFAVAAILGAGPVLHVEYDGKSYAFTHVLITVPALLMVLQVERARREEVTQAFEYQAMHDSLTGLPNRAKFTETLTNALSEAARNDSRVAVFLLDLDRFKDINDTLGHAVGDILLQELANRLSHNIPKHAMLARFGGDEFALVLSDVLDADTAKTFASFVLSEIQHPFVVDDIILEVGGSIGISIFPEHGSSCDELLQHADIAMYAAKRDHLGYQLYSPEEDPHSVRTLTLTADLRRAIKLNELDLAFQPKVDVQTGEMVGAEVLARWRQPGQEHVCPDEFIPHAEQTGLIYPLTKWVLNAALERASEWRQAGRDIELAVNLSARLLHHSAILATVVSILRKWDYPPERLTLEITENAILIDPKHAMEMVAQFADLGIKVSIDDFGTGYSSLAYLKTLAAREVKIDKSFVLGMHENESDRTIVKSVIALAHDLGLTVVAEGIERMETWAILEAYGCDGGQGFHFGRPMAASSFEHCFRLTAASAPDEPAGTASLRSADVVTLSPKMLPVSPNRDEIPLIPASAKKR